MAFEGCAMSRETALSPGETVAQVARHVSVAEIDVRERTDRAEPLVARAPVYGVEPVVEKWPAWKVSLGVILFCGVFWTGAIYLIMRLTGH